MKHPLTLIAALALASAGAHQTEPAHASHPVGQLQTRDAHAMLWLPDGRILFGHHDGVQVSTDRGNTWKGAFEKPNFDAMNLQRAGKTLVLAGHDVYATSPDGKQWTSRTFKGLGGTDLHAYAVNPNNPREHYAWEARTGLHGSTDGGKTWKASGAQNLPSDIMGLAAAPDGSLYALSARSGLWRSEDRAGTFSALKTPATQPYTVTVAEDGAVWLGGKDGVWRQQKNAWSKVADGVAILIAVNPRKPTEAVWVNEKGAVLRNTE